MASELNDFLEVEGAPADVGSSAAAGGDGAAPAGADGGAAAAGADGAAPAPGADGAAAAGADGAAAAAPAVADPPEEIPEDVRGLRSALQAERGKRNDYKGERDRAVGELAATKAALAAAEARAAAPAPVAAAPAPVVADPPAPAAPTVPNPAEDPAGYHAHTQRMLFNERLNLSEAMLRGTPGIEAVDEKLAAFKKAADVNPALRSELSRQPHPYRWAYDQGTRLLAMAEVGDDPAAFRAKVEAEIRAKVEAELSGKAAPQGAVEAVVLPRSLAGQTSSAPRLAVVEEAPAFEDIFKPRRRAS